MDWHASRRTVSRRSLHELPSSTNARRRPLNTTIPRAARAAPQVSLRRSRSPAHPGAGVKGRLPDLCCDLSAGHQLELSECDRLPPIPAPQGRLRDNNSRACERGRQHLPVAYHTLPLLVQTFLAGGLPSWKVSPSTPAISWKGCLPLARPSSVIRSNMSSVWLGS